MAMGENTNPSGSLRAAVFRLRKTLEGCGLPEHEYIRTDRRHIPVGRRRGACVY